MGSESCDGIGTLPYAAPEVFHASSAQAFVSSSYTQKIDVWSFGVIVFEFHVRKRRLSFPGLFANREAMFNSAIETASCSRAIKTVLSKCLRNDPERRPDFHQILDMLQKEAFGTPALRDVSCLRQTSSFTVLPFLGKEIVEVLQLINNAASATIAEDSLAARKTRWDSWKSALAAEVEGKLSHLSIGSSSDVRSNIVQGRNLYRWSELFLLSDALECTFHSCIVRFPSPSEGRYSLESLLSFLLVEEAGEVGRFCSTLKAISACVLPDTMLKAVVTLLGAFRKLPAQTHDSAATRAMMNAMAHPSRELVSFPPASAGSDPFSATKSSKHRPDETNPDGTLRLTPRLGRTEESTASERLKDPSALKTRRSRSPLSVRQKISPSSLPVGHLLCPPSEEEQSGVSTRAPSSTSLPYCETEASFENHHQASRKHAQKKLHKQDDRASNTEYTPSSPSSYVHRLPRLEVLLQTRRSPLIKTHRAVAFWHSRFQALKQELSRRCASIEIIENNALISELFDLLNAAQPGAPWHTRSKSSTVTSLTSIPGSKELPEPAPIPQDRQSDLAKSHLQLNLLTSRKVRLSAFSPSHPHLHASSSVVFVFDIH